MSHSNRNKWLITIRSGHSMNSVFVNTGIVASLVIVVIVAGIFFKLHKYKIQYVAVTQNINTILSGADEQELATLILSLYHGIFTD